MNRVTLIEYGEVRVALNENCAATEFCKSKWRSPESKCEAHYKALFEKTPTKSLDRLVKCPYGMATTGVYQWFKLKCVFTSLWREDTGELNVPAEVKSAAEKALGVLEKWLVLLGEVVAAVKSEELMHFEAAVHDARHLNQSITLNAEKLLDHFGYAQSANWDMGLMQRNLDHRAALSIFSASRDLSNAISIHEISRDPSLAGMQPERIKIHSEFYKQLRISFDRVEKKKLRIFIGLSQKELTLSKAFRLVPKIILDNAIKYAERNSEIKVNFIEAGQFFKIQCENSGRIVRDDEEGKVFDCGFRGSNKGDEAGHGLGLWLAKTIVEANIGRIEFEIMNKRKDVSLQRIGTTRFTITVFG